MRRVMLSASVLVCLVLSSCALFGPPLEIEVAYAPDQHPEIANLEFPVLFPEAAAIAALVPDAEVASHGPTLGATLAVVQMTSNQTFYVTGVRIENVRYRLMVVDDGGLSDGSPIGTSSGIEYIHPILGAVSPIVSSLGLAPEAESAVLKVPKSSDAVPAATFEVGLSSALSMWSFIDLDRDGVNFPADDDEVAEITCSMVFEGYLESGIEFTGAFPPPLLVNIVVKHDV